MSILENAKTAERSAPRSPVSAAVHAISQGQPVIVEQAGRGADLVLAAELADARNIAFLVKHTSGLLSVALPEQRCDQLQLPRMIPARSDPAEHSAACAVSVDAAEGISTGISARDRARTIRLLAADSTRPRDFRRPGHVLPLRTHPAGVLRSPRPAEACMDLCRLAGLRPVGVRSELVRPDGAIPSVQDLRAFGASHGLVRLTIDELAAYRRAFDLTVQRLTEWRMPTEHGIFRAIGYRSAHDDTEHLALVMGTPEKLATRPIREHRECTHGDVFGALDCACASSLRDGLRSIADSGAGVLVYLRNGVTLHGHPIVPDPDVGVQQQLALGSYWGTVGMVDHSVRHPVALAILRDLGIHDEVWTRSD